MDNGSCDVKAVLEAILEPAAFGSAPAHWETAMSAMPAGKPAFLDGAAIPARRAAAGLPPERDAELMALARQVADDPALLRFAWYLHWRVFLAPQHGCPWGAPSLVNRLGEKAGLFYELLALEFPPRLAAWHHHLGYPAAVTEETTQQIRSFEGNHLRGRGCPGLYEGQFVWLAIYLTNPYVRLGRLEYMLTRYNGVNAWKDSEGHVMALAEDGTRVADDGLCLTRNAPVTEGWTARQVEENGVVRGFPIDPAGRILRNEVRLDPAIWRPCLSKGMTILDLHIPAGGGMSWEAVVDSFAQALEFFPRHHPDQPFVALVCWTWFLDAQLADLLPGDAHILRFQRAVYLIPVSGPDGLWFVFLRDALQTDPTALPQDTTLRRALAGFLRSGGVWHGGTMFLLAEDMARPREGTYRERFPRETLPFTGRLA